MISKKMQDLLNAQIGVELESSIIYLQMGAWCQAQGLEGCASFLRAHSREEMGHMFRIHDYLMQNGEQAIIPAISKAPHEFKSVLDVFETALEHEKFVTGKINDLVGAAMGEKDFGTFSFLQWYVTEQQEEEALFGKAVDLAKLIGVDGRGLFMLDREIARLHQAPPPAAGGGE